MSAVRYLDFRAASARLAEIGITRPDGSPVPADTVRTWADKGKLPFFKGPDNKRRIAEPELLSAFAKLQTEAAKPSRRK